MKNKKHYPWLKGREFAPTTEPQWGQPLQGIDTVALMRLQDRMIRSFIRKLANPVEIDSTTDYREVEVLRTIAYRVTPGKVSALITIKAKTLNEVCPGKYRIHWEGVGHDGSVIRPLDFYQIITGFISLWSPAIDRVVKPDVPLEDRQRVAENAECCLRERIEAVFRRLVKSDYLNRLAGRRLGLNARAVAMGRRFHPATIDCSVRDYQIAEAHLDLLTGVLRDQPNLLWLALPMVSNPTFDKSSEPVAAMRRGLLERGLNKQGWRMLTRDRSVPPRAYFASPHFPEESLTDMVSWINLHTRAGLRDLLPGEFWSLLTLNDYHPDGIRDRPLDIGRKLSLGMFSILARKVRQCDEEGTLAAWLLTDWRRFADWHLDHPDVVPDRNQTKAGWTWLARQISDWEEAVELGLLKSSLYWDVAMRRFADSQYEAVALDSVRKLWEEGSLMSHCVGNLDYRVEQDDALFYSVRDASSGKRLVTLEIVKSKRRGCWVACCCHGRFNTPPPPELLPFLSAVANAYNRATGLPEYWPDSSAVTAAQAANDEAHDRLFETLFQEQRAA